MGLRACPQSKISPIPGYSEPLTEVRSLILRQGMHVAILQNLLLEQAPAVEVCDRCVDRNVAICVTTFAMASVRAPPLSPNLFATLLTQQQRRLRLSSFIRHGSLLICSWPATRGTTYRVKLGHYKTGVKENLDDRTQKGGCCRLRAGPSRTDTYNAAT